MIENIRLIIRFPKNIRIQKNTHTEKSTRNPPTDLEPNGCPLGSIPIGKVKTIRPRPDLKRFRQNFPVCTIASEHTSHVLKITENLVGSEKIEENLVGSVQTCLLSWKETEIHLLANILTEKSPWNPTEPNHSQFAPITPRPNWNQSDDRLVQPNGRPPSSQPIGKWRKQPDLSPI